MAALKEKYEKLMKYMKANDFPKIYVIGFSWGAWFAMKMSAEYDNIKAIVGIHPALQVEKFLGGSEEQLVECVKCPILLEVSSGEGPNVKKGGDLINILTKKFGTGAGVEQFPDMAHGWMTKGDIQGPNVKRDTQKAIKCSLDYLSRF